MSEQERAAILSDLRDGLSLRATARKRGRGVATVSRVANGAGLDLERSATQKAASARRDYAQAERLALLNRLFDKCAQILPTCKKPYEVMQLATAMAIAIDKRRLEDGEATSRTEVNTDGVRDRILGRLDELASRRAAKGAA
jgi:hypothetical protein